MRTFLAAILLLQATAVFPLPEIPEQPDLILRSAFDAELRQDNRAALNLYDQFLASRGQDSAFIHAQRARLLQAARKNDEAIKESFRAMELSESRKEYYILSAELLRQTGRKSESFGLLTRANERFPDDGEVEFFLAEIALDVGKNPDSTIHYKQVLFYGPNAGSRFGIYRSVALMRLAIASLRNGDRVAAGKYLKRYIQYNPDRILAHYLLGYEVYSELGDYESAIKELEFVALADPGAATEQGADLRKTYAALGLMYYFFNDKACEKYLNYLAEREKEGLFTGLLAAFRGQNRKAFSNLLPVVTKTPGNIFARLALLRIQEKNSTPEEMVKVRFGFSTVAFQNNRHGTGIEQLTQAAVANANASKSQHIDLSLIRSQMAAGHLAMHQHHRAIVYYRMALQEFESEKKNSEDAAAFSKRYAELAFSLARSFITSDKNRLNEALALLDKAPVKDDPRTGAEKAKLLQDAGDYARAVDAWTAVMSKTEKEKDSENGPTFAQYFYRAAAYERLGKIELAEADAKKAFDLRPDFPPIQNFLGYLYSLLGKNQEESSTLIEKAIAADPINGSYHDSLGWAYHKKKDDRRARYHLQFASRLLEESGEKNPEVYDHLGEVYLSMGDRNRSLYNFETAVHVLSEKKKLDPIEVSLQQSISAKIKRITEAK